MQVDVRALLEEYADQRITLPPHSERQTAASRAFNALRDVLNEHHERHTSTGRSYCLQDGFTYPCGTVRAIHAALSAEPLPASLQKTWEQERRPA